MMLGAGGAEAERRDPVVAHVGSDGNPEARADGQEWLLVSCHVGIAKPKPRHPASHLRDPVSAGPLQVVFQARPPPGRGERRLRAWWTGWHRLVEEIPHPRLVDVEEREEVEHHAPQFPEDLFLVRWEQGIIFTPAGERNPVRGEKLLEECAVDADLTDEPIDLGAQGIRRFFLEEVRDSRLHHHAAPPVKFVRTAFSIHLLRTSVNTRGLVGSLAGGTQRLGLSLEFSEVLPTFANE
jgi:hypothetical protein